MASLWSRLILKTCLVGVEVEGAERLEPGRTYVFVANHQSLFDTPIVFGHLPASFRILYKRSLNRIPFLGWHLFLAGHIGVERENPTKARESLERAVGRVRNGTSVVLFPEGTRSYDGRMANFKKGSFRLAIQAGAPVVPLTIVDSYLVMRRGEVTVHPRKVRLVISEPIPVEDLDDADIQGLAERTREAVGAVLKKPTEGVSAS